MMAKKRCQYCGKLFIPDSRVGARQRACSAQCQKNRKKDNNKTYRKNNPGYWEGRYQYLKEWRQRNPGYQKQWRQKRKQPKPPGEIQAEIFAKALDSVEKNVTVLREIQAEILSKMIGAVGRKTFSASRWL